MARDKSVGRADDDANSATKKHSTAKASTLAVPDATTGTTTRKSARLAAKVDPKTASNAAAAKTTTNHKNGKKVKTVNVKAAKTPSQPSPPRPPLTPVQPSMSHDPTQLQSSNLPIPPLTRQLTSSNPKTTVRTPPSKGTSLFSNWTKIGQNRILANSFAPQNQNAATDSTTVRQSLPQPTLRMYRATPTAPSPPPQGELRTILAWNPREGTAQVGQMPGIERNGLIRRAGSVPTYWPWNDPPPQLQRNTHEAESEEHSADLGVWEVLLGKLICILPFLLVSLFIGALLTARLLNCTLSSSRSCTLHAEAPFPSSHSERFGTPFSPETISQLSTFAETIGADPWLLKTCILPRQITSLPLVTCQKRLPWYNLTSAQVGWLNEKTNWGYELNWAITEQFNHVWEMGFEAPELMTSWMLSPDGPSAGGPYEAKRCDACVKLNQKADDEQLLKSKKQLWRIRNWTSIWNWNRNWNWKHNFSLARLVSIGQKDKNNNNNKNKDLPTSREDAAKARLLAQTDPKSWADILLDDGEDDDDNDVEEEEEQEEKDKETEGE